MRKGKEWLPFTPSSPISTLQEIKRQSFSTVLGSNNNNKPCNNNNNKLIAHILTYKILSHNKMETSEKYKEE